MFWGFFFLNPVGFGFQDIKGWHFFLTFFFFFLSYDSCKPGQTDRLLLSLLLHEEIMTSCTLPLTIWTQ